MSGVFGTKPIPRQKIIPLFDDFLSKLLNNTYLHFWLKKDNNFQIVGSANDTSRSEIGDLDIVFNRKHLKINYQFFFYRLMSSSPPFQFKEFKGLNLISFKYQFEGEFYQIDLFIPPSPKVAIELLTSSNFSKVKSVYRNLLLIDFVKFFPVLKEYEDLNDSTLKAEWCLTPTEGLNIHIKRINSIKTDKLLANPKTIKKIKVFDDFDVILIFLFGIHNYHFIKNDFSYEILLNLIQQHSIFKDDETLYISFQERYKKSLIDNSLTIPEDFYAKH